MPRGHQLTLAINRETDDILLVLQEYVLALRLNVHLNCHAGSRIKYALEILCELTLVSHLVLQVLISNSEDVVDFQLLFGRLIVLRAVELAEIRGCFYLSDEMIGRHRFHSLSLLNSILVIISSRHLRRCFHFALKSILVFIEDIFESVLIVD